MQNIEAVVGVLRNKNQEILITKRQHSQFMAGFWELPGGKREAGESLEQTLARELNEELGIKIKHFSVHRTITHQYQNSIITLSIYNINQYQKKPKGMEGQAIAWVKIKNLGNYKLLPTMKTFLDSITLPNKYWITPAVNHQSDEWIKVLEQKLIQGIKLVQLRSKIPLHNIIIDEVKEKCQQYNATLLLNTPNKDFNKTDVNGWHLTSRELFAVNARPCADDKLLGASTHNLDEALKAQEIGANFIVIAPVKVTQTHPDAKPLGWDNAAEIANKIDIPVYFLGGMSIQDLDKTLKLGAQGIASISAF